MALVKEKATKGMVQDEAMAEAIAGNASPDYEESGDKEQSLSTFPPGSYVTKAMVGVTGVAFQGKLKFLKGVKITPSPVVYGTDGNPKQPSVTEQAFIVDFTGMRSVIDTHGFTAVVLSATGFPHPVIRESALIPAFTGGEFPLN